MAEPDISADVPRKWCRLCEEWKAAILMVAETSDSMLKETKREIIYCPECGAKLTDKPN